ncbi:MAG: helix-turn-helix domain-containing protein [Arcobacteraceae bacterium]|nr:helix-turn-helix domain-containing protein [Arcobacteraceae bacterium]
MNINDIFDRLFEFYNINSISELSQKIGISQPAISKWKTRNSISAAKKKCRELGIYNDIFGDINTQSINTITGGQVAQNVAGNMANNNDTDKLNFDEDILSTLKTVSTIINQDNKESFKKHIKSWIVDNL